MLLSLLARGSRDCPIVSCGSRVSFCPVCGGKVRAVLFFRVCFRARMAEELEMLWQKLKVTEEEEVSVNLGEECTRAANERGKNCLVMKVLSRRSIMLEAIRKNIRMLWKPNKSLQLSVIGEELFLAEFKDERDKRRVMDMRPWHYEK